jgi:hypothetical protein
VGDGEDREESDHRNIQRDCDQATILECGSCDEVRAVNQAQASDRRGDKGFVTVGRQVAPIGAVISANCSFTYAPKAPAAHRRLRE